ncbi:hypothetical protein [Streptomyces showdoensis]|uniref:Membrane protein n=1 Tax=Streptomyces showdoensis TaxID=68268 RepID=A0A2P2GML3_STREW|nr:hypothetical protein [Streptomyces showdoensis]KKZ72744.1 membrane protein [Streptomyces showdoensis]
MSSDQHYPYEPQGGQGGQPYDPHVTQTWEGQTWDTQFQPTVQPQQPQQPVSYDTAYLPPQGQTQGHAQAPETYGHGYTTGGHPLPPESPAAYPQAYGTPAPVYGTPAPAHEAPAPVYGTPAPAHEAPAPAYEAAAYAEAPAPVPAASAPASGPEGAVDADGPAYSTPTMGGNARITDAQRARAEGRSPVIEPGMQPAALTAVLGVLLAVGASAGSYALLVPLLLLQAVTAAGWFRLNGMWPARQGIALAFLGGVTADVALLAAGRENAPAAILGTLGVWVLLTLVLQLRSHADPDERMYGLMATVASAALAVLAAGHLGAEPDAVVVGGVAVAAAVLARAVPLPGPVSVVVALLAAAGGGIAAGGLTDLGASGALLGLVAGVCALIGLRVASYDYPSRFVHMTAGVALPLTAAAPAVYLLGRALA